MRAIFLDIETTGLDAAHHCPIDIAFKVINLSDGKQELSYQSLIKLSEKQWQERDLESMKINGYTYSQVFQGKELQHVQNDIIEQFTLCNIARGTSVFICQNPSFDRAFFSRIIDPYHQERLNWPYHWLDLASMYWALLLQSYDRDHKPHPSQLNLSKNSIAENLLLPTETEPHSAQNGVEHLVLCYQKLFTFYQQPHNHYTYNFL